MLLKKVLTISVLLLSVFSLHSIVIGMAEVELRGETLYSEEIELSLEERDFTARLLAYLKGQALPDRVRFVQLDNLVHLQEPVTTALKAEEAAYLAGLDYIVYGSVRKSATYYDGTFNLYSRNEQKAVFTIYVKRELESFDDFVKLSGERLLEELMEQFSFTLERTTRRDFKAFGYLLIHNAIGYSIPFQPWWERLTGIAQLESGIYFGMIPLKQVNRDINLRLRFGQTTAYTISINKPAYLTTIHSTLQFNFPLMLGLEFFERYHIFWELAPAATIDFSYQKESHRPDRLEGTAAFSLLLATGFEYWLGEERKIALGVKAAFDLTFYTPFRGSFRPQIYISNKIDFKREE